MNVCVVGFGHFASIVAAVVASRGHVVMQADEEPHLVRANQIAPDAEPGYSELAQSMRDARRLVDTLPSVDVYWIAYDVPLDAEGHPIGAEILRRIVALHRRVPAVIPFLVSCQWPVGTTAEMEAACLGRKFVYVLENVRAGKAVTDLQDQQSFIIGVRHREFGALEADASSVLLLSICRNKGIVMMSPESAELSKHALNAFMALQIAFVNEIADVAAKVSADPADISRALLSDPRVSPRAPLKPGKPFGGGSLQRDLLVLEHLSKAPILHAIRASNDSRS